MNARVLAALALLTGGLGAAWLYSHRSSAAKPEVPSKIGGASPTTVDPTPTSQGVQSPGDASPAGLVQERTSAQDGKASEKDPALEAVEPLLALNLVVANETTDSSPESMSAKIDELLDVKHAGKTKPQLLKYFHSIDVELQRQANPKLIPAEEVLAPEAINALRIEATWLKERIYN